MTADTSDADMLSARTMFSLPLIGIFPRGAATSSKWANAAGLPAKLGAIPLEKVNAM
jgi:hypothetical protein